jgi:hypothetical protein
VAEQALILAYQAQEVFHRIRSIVGFSDEGSTRKREPHESLEETRQRDSEPDQEMDSAPIMLDEARAKRAGLAIRSLQALVLAILLAFPYFPAHADQAPAMTLPLPISIAQTALQG